MKILEHENILIYHNKLTMTNKFLSFYIKGNGEERNERSRNERKRCLFFPLQELYKGPCE